MLNLLFSLHVSSRPLTTSEIVDDPEIGYLGKKSATRDSRCKAFRRDRETLAEHGVHIHEVPPQYAGGIAVNEESAWAIDREQHMPPKEFSRLMTPRRSSAPSTRSSSSMRTTRPYGRCRRRAPSCANSLAETRRHPSGQMKAGLT